MLFPSLHWECRGLLWTFGDLKTHRRQVGPESNSHPLIPAWWIREGDKDQKVTAHSLPGNAGFRSCWYSISNWNLGTTPSHHFNSLLLLLSFQGSLRGQRKENLLTEEWRLAPFSWPCGTALISKTVAWGSLAVARLSPPKSHAQGWQGPTLYLPLGRVWEVPSEFMAP